MDKPKPSTQTTDTQHKPRRVYTPPALITFGSVEEFTRGTGSANNDRFGGGRVKLT